MISTKCNYDTYNKELLAIVKTFKYWRYYLEGSQYPVKVLADYVNLQYFMTMKELSEWQVQWAEHLAAFDFEIYYYKGSMNPADSPSHQLNYELKGADNNKLLLPIL